jgi:hypothetical protein
MTGVPVSSCCSRSNIVYLGSFLMKSGEEFIGQDETYQCRSCGYGWVMPVEADDALENMQ